MDPGFLPEMGATSWTREFDTTWQRSERMPRRSELKVAGTAETPAYVGA